MIEYSIKQSTHENFRYVGLTITNQSSRGSAFAHGYSTFYASNGWMLKSSGRPEYRGSEKILFVRGRDTTKDHDSVYIPVDKLVFVMSAIEEYNESFG